MRDARRRKLALLRVMVNIFGRSEWWRSATLSLIFDVTMLGAAYLCWSFGVSSGHGAATA